MRKSNKVVFDKAKRDLGLKLNLFLYLI